MSGRVCPACTAPAGQADLRVREMMFGLPESFSYRRCTSCGTVALDEVPADLSAYYPDDYYSVDLDPERVLGRRPARDVVRVVGRSALFGRARVAEATRRYAPRRQVRTLASLFDGVRRAGLPAGAATPVLDVGCGSGLLVYALGLAGLTDVTGVDPFAPGDRRLDTGGRLLRRDLGEVEGPYGLVMFHHSLEHVVDVEQSLRQAATRLAPGGRVLVRMPTVSSQAYEEYGTDWVQFDAPRHITLLSRPGMTAVAQRCGLRVLSVHDDSTGFQFWGSEQVRRGLPLTDDRSHMMTPARSPFGRAKLLAWERRSRALNAAGLGDQAAWVLAAG